MKQVGLRKGDFNELKVVKMSKKPQFFWKTEERNYIDKCDRSQGLSRWIHGSMKLEEDQFQCLGKIQKNLVNLVAEGPSKLFLFSRRDLPHFPG
jgi:hypothetical protein